MYTGWGEESKGVEGEILGSPGIAYKMLGVGCEVVPRYRIGYQTGGRWDGLRGGKGRIRRAKSGILLQLVGLD